MGAIEVEANCKDQEELDCGRSRQTRGDYVAGDTEYYWKAGQGVHQSQGRWEGLARGVGVEGSNLSVSHSASAISCAKELVRMASPAEKEMSEMMMIWCRGSQLEKNTWTTTQTTRSDWTAAGDDGEVETDTTNKNSSNDKPHRTAHRRQAIEQQQKEQRQQPQQPVEMQTKQSQLNANRIVVKLRLELEESAKQREQDAWCLSQVWCMSQYPDPRWR